MKRSRGRNRRNGGSNQNNQFNNPNRHYESVGPDVKIRGSAQQVLEKYQQYARDAQTSGDRILSEAYFQYAEHYQRIVAKQAEARAQQAQSQQGFHNRPPREDGQSRPDQRRDHQNESNDENAEAVVESRHAPQPSEAPLDRDDDRSDAMRVIGREDRDEVAEIPSRPERSERPDRQDRQDRQDRGERSERQNREPRGERPDRGDRGERSEREPRRERTENRKPYTPREDRAPREERTPRSEAPGSDDGVMKTLSRGRRRPAEDTSGDTE